MGDSSGFLTEREICNANDICQRMNGWWYSTMETDPKRERERVPDPIAWTFQMQSSVNSWLGGFSPQCIYLSTLAERSRCQHDKVRSMNEKICKQHRTDLAFVERACNGAKIDVVKVTFWWWRRRAFPATKPAWILG
jgi:hypothetical protein